MNIILFSRPIKTEARKRGFYHLLKHTKKNILEPTEGGKYAAAKWQAKMAKIRTKRNFKAVFRKYTLTVLFTIILSIRPDIDSSEIRFGITGNDRHFTTETSTIWHLQSQKSTKTVLAKVPYVELSTKRAEKFHNRHKNIKIKMEVSGIILSPVEDSSEDDESMSIEDESEDDWNEIDSDETSITEGSGVKLLSLGKTKAGIEKKKGRPKGSKNNSKTARTKNKRSKNKSRNPGRGRGGGGPMGGRGLGGPGSRISKVGSGASTSVDSSQSTLSFAPTKETPNKNTPNKNNGTTTGTHQDATIDQQTPSKPAPMLEVDKLDEAIPKSILQAPILKSVSNEKTREPEQITTTYTTRIQYRRKVKASPDVIEVIKSLMACMMQYNQSVHLLPYSDDNKNNPLITPRDIPNDVNDFGIYVPTAVVSKNSSVLFMKFRIESNMPLYKLKNVKGIKNFLDRWNIFLDQMYIKSHDTAKIGGFLMSHCQYTRREQANMEINTRLNENEDHQLSIQLSPHHFWHGSGGNKVSTRLLAVECARADTKETRERIFRKLMNVPDKFEFGNTRYFRFMPFVPTPTLTSDAIRNGIMYQNSFLLGLADIQLKHIDHADWIVPGMEIPFKQFVLEVNIEGTNKKLFNNIETSSGFGKIYLLTTKQNLDIARKWVDDTISIMDNKLIDAEDLKKMTGHTRVFRRVDQISTSDAEQAYSANMIQALEIGGITSNVRKSGPSNAPQKKAWNRVFYGPDMSQTTVKTTEESVSTITNTALGITQQVYEDGLKKLQCEQTAATKKHGDDMLYEAREMTARSDERTKTLEAMAERTDMILREVLTTQKSQQKEMEVQHTNMEAMSILTHKTAEKMDTTIETVDKTSAKVDITSGKLDKLQNTLCVFMKRISTSVNSQNNSQTQNVESCEVKDLCAYLHNADEAMDSVSNLTTQLSPPSAASSLRDGGRQ